MNDGQNFRPSVLFAAIVPEPVQLQHPLPSKDFSELARRQEEGQSIPGQMPLMVPLAPGRRLTPEEIQLAPRQIVFRASKPAVKNAGRRRHAIRIGTVPLISEHLSQVLDEVAPGAFQFLPIDVLDAADRAPLWPDNRFFLAHCVNNVDPFDLWDPEDLVVREMDEPRGGFDRSYRFKNLSYPRVNRDFSTEFGVFHSMRYLYYADISAGKGNHGAETVYTSFHGMWFCSHNFVAAILDRAPKVTIGFGGCDYNRFVDCGPISTNPHRLAGLFEPFVPTR